MTRRRAPFPLYLLAGLLAAYLIAPLAAGVDNLAGADWRSLDVGELASATFVSLASATVSTAIVTLCGVPLGYFLGRRQGRAVALLGFLVQLPLALPPLSSGVLLLFLVGYSSPIGALTGGALTDSFAGVVLAQIFVSAPFLVIAARSAFSEVDGTLEDVAATLGKKPWAIYWEVVVPLAWRTIAAGMMLAWLRAFGEFGATVMVAYHPYSLPVYTFVAFGSSGLPAMIPVLVPTLAAAFIVMIASATLVGRRPRALVAQRDDEEPARVRPRSHRRASPWPAPTPDEPSLEFAFARRLEGFELNAAWSARARRLAILGASGSGKSMTLRCIAGLDPAEGDMVRISGRDASRLPPQARGVSFVPQNFGLFPHMTVRRQIQFASDVEGPAARRWIERLGLESLQNRLPAELSLGQQQRVALARALARRADLILLDEPFSAFDAPLRARMRNDLLELQRDFSAATALVTHDPAEALLLADELLLLEAGSVLQTGPVEEVFLRPANEAAARLTGAENVNYGCVVGARAVSVGRGVTIEVAGAPLVIGTHVAWAVRTERIRIHSGGRYPAAVLSSGPARAGARNMTIQMGDAELVVAADPSSAPPETLDVEFDPQAVQVWPLAPARAAQFADAPAPAEA